MAGQPEDHVAAEGFDLLGYGVAFALCKCGSQVAAMSTPQGKGVARTWRAPPMRPAKFCREGETLAGDAAPSSVAVLSVALALGD